MPSAIPVTIEIDGPFATIDPPCADVIGDLLTYWESVCQPGGPLGYRLERRRAVLGGPDENGCLVTLAGLVPRIVAHLEAAGHHVEVRHVTAQDERLVPDRQLLGTAQDEDRAYLDALTANYRGQVVYHSDRQLGHLLGLACRAYPAARVLVVARNRRQVRSLLRQVRHRLKGGVSAGVGRGHDPGARLLLITMQQFRPAMGDPDFRGVVLLVDADRIVTASVSEQALGRIGHRRVYGFVRPDLRLSEREGLELEGVCGPVAYEAPGPSGRAVDVRVVVAEPPWTPGPSADSVLQCKRRAVWHNRGRNEAVATLATSLAAGREEDLCHRGLLRPDVQLPKPSIVGRHVVILVESTEHGREMIQLLPDWRLFAAPTAAAGELLPESGLPAKSIVTLVAASTLGQLPADVLIWAGGGEGSLDLPGFPPSSGTGRHEVVVVDFADDGDKAAERATQSRLRAYARLGWEISGPAQRLLLPEHGAEEHRLRPRDRRTKSS
jgi:hypothetical protein